MRIQKKDIRDYVCLVIATIAAFGFISAHRCATEISVRYYEVRQEKINEQLRIVQLSDLHGHIFGIANEELVEIVAAQQPDLIVMTGDMLDKQDENADVVCRLIRELQPVAPIYCCYGNHEKDWISGTGIDLNALLTESGAIVLDAAYQDIILKGQQLRLGGYHGYYRQPGMFRVTPQQREAELAFADAFEQTEVCKILLCHIPEAWLDWRYIDKFPVDLVLAGHYHGGQVRLPLIGGLVAPNVGWFPEYTEGLFYGEQAACVLSTGLGSGQGIPRINNLPQVVVVDILPHQ